MRAKPALRLGVDPRLEHTFSEAGDYTIELHITYFEYAGRNFAYQLKVGPFDYARSVFPLGGKRGETLQVSVVNSRGTVTQCEARVPADPNADEWLLPLPAFPGSLPWRMAAGDFPEIMEAPASSKLQTMPWPATINGRIDRPGEVDRYRLVVQPDQKISMRVEAYYHGSALTGRIRVLDASGKMLADAHARSRSTMDPQLDFTVPSGVNEITVAIEDCFGLGGITFPYRLTVEPGGGDFALITGTDFPETGWPENDALNLSIGQPCKLAVKVQRRGYQGPIQLQAVDIPAGVAVAPATIPEGQFAGELHFTASAQAPGRIFEIGVIGEALIEGRLVRRLASRPIHLAEPGLTNLPWNWRLTRLTCVKVGAAP